MNNMICQIGILVMGALTIWMLAQKKSWMRWGYIIGALQEIFWFYSSYINKQWGIFILCFVYTYCYLLGVYNYWIKK